MKKISKKIFLVVCLVAGIMFSSGAVTTKAFVPKGPFEDIGDGWLRVDDANMFINRPFSWKVMPSNPVNCYRATLSECKDVKDPLTFRFRGTKFRIIGAKNNTIDNYGSESVRVTVDGVYLGTFSCNDNLTFGVNLFTTKEDLKYGEHVVSIQSESAKGKVWVDAIDIGSNDSNNKAELLNANPLKVFSLSLDKKEMTINAGETQNLTASILPENATQKKLTWTSSNPAICKVDANGKVTAVSSGQAVVTATTTDGSRKSASCKVTVVDNNNAILTINMKSGKTYSYELAMTEINAFDTWYKNRANGEGSPVYKFTLPNGDVHTMNYNSILNYAVH